MEFDGGNLFMNFLHIKKGVNMYYISSKSPKKTHYNLQYWIYTWMNSVHLALFFEWVGETVHERQEEGIDNGRIYLCIVFSNRYTFNMNALSVYSEL